MKRCHAAVSAFLFLATPLFASAVQEDHLIRALNEPREEALAPDARESTQEDAARQRLAAVVPDLRFDETPLSDAFAALRSKTGANIFVNWKALDAEGISRNTPVTLRVKQKRLSAAIDLLMSVASTDGKKFGYAVEGGVITVSTKDDLDKNVAIRVYDVRDLLAAGKGDRAARADAIVKFVTDQVDPKSWKSAGGHVAAIRELQGQLIVTQTPLNQERIVKLLAGVHDLLGPGSINSHPDTLLRARPSSG